MTGSEARVRGAALAVVLAAGLSATNAAAQDRPLPLLPETFVPADTPAPAPSSAPPAASGPTSSTPGFDIRPGTASSDDGPPPPLGPAVELAPPPGGLTAQAEGGTFTPAQRSTIAEPIPALGTLRPGAGGLPDDPWVGTPLAEAVGLITALPTSGSSPVVADLRRRLLLTAQMAPGNTPSAALQLLAARLEVLDHLGAPANAIVALTDPVHPALRDEAMDRARLDAWLIEADDRAACGLVNRVGAAHAAPLWEKASVHCALLAGRADQAMLGLSVLREMAPGADDAFYRLAERLAGSDSPPPDSMADASVVTYRLLRMSEGVDAPADALRANRPWTARALALSGAGPAEVLAAAAERATAVGALTVDHLADIWGRLPVDPRDLETPISKAALGDRPLDRALAFIILSRETDPARLAEGLLHPLESVRSRHPELYPLHARLYAPMIRALPVLPSVPAFLGTAAGRALYTAGSIEAGRVWLADLQRQGETNRDAEEAAALLWPIARVADAAMRGPLPTDRLILWRQARAARLGEGAEAARELDREHVLLLRMLEALGAPVTEAHWLPVRTNRVFFETVSVDGGFHDPDRLEALATAAEARQMGAVVANALLAMGPDGPGGASLETLRAVLSALRGMGMDAEARQIALEALVAHGV